MATPQLVTVRDFTSSRYAQLAEAAEGVNLGDVLARAEATLQAQMGRAIKNTQYTETFRAQSQTLFVKQRPITSVVSLRRRASILSAWQTIDLSRVRFESGPGYLEIYDSVRGYDVEITYMAGYTSTPEDIKEAVLTQAVLLTFQDLEIYGSGDAKAPGILYVQKDIERLIAPYRATATVYH